MATFEKHYADVPTRRCNSWHESVVMGVWRRLRGVGGGVVDVGCWGVAPVARWTLGAALVG
jgi:hypothetical protein